jgi:glycosyltransferase involved in cell wall biosynthesis
VSRSPRVCHVFPAFANGGPEIRTSTLINALGSEFDHTIIALDGNISGQARFGPADPVHFVTPPARRTVFALAEILRQQQPDLLVSYGWGGTDAVIAGRLAGFGRSRVVHAEDGFLPDEAVRQKPSRRLARRLILRLAATVVVPSRTLCRIGLDAWHLSPARITYIPNGVDLTRFSKSHSADRASIRQQLGIASDETVVGTAGVLRIEKNLARLVRAFASIGRRDMRLLIVGDGPERQRISELALELGIAPQVMIPGMVQDTAPYYAAMDVFALSSDTEQMPLALLEAMASGLPAVVTDVGDVSTMIGARNKRFLVPADAGQQYGQAMRALVEDPLRQDIGADNREKCTREFSLDRMIRAYRNLYYTFAAGDHAGQRRSAPAGLGSAS